MSLLLRYYEPTSGQITINGRSIADYDVQHLRKHIGIVSQEPVRWSWFLFSLHVRIQIDSLWCEYL